MIPTLARQYFFYQRSQRWNRSQIEFHQDERLRRLIRHAGRHVPYYRDLFREIGLDPERFRGREDMAKIPLLDKETVRTRAQELIADNASHYGVVWESTSGSTGTPLRVIVDRGARANKLAALIRSYQWAGYRLGKKIFSLQSYYLKGTCWQYHRLFRVLRFDSVRLKEETALGVIRVMQKVKPYFFMGFPFDLHILARFAEQAGLKIPTPGGMVTYGETLSSSTRRALEAAYHCGVFDYYSQHECAAMIAECESHHLHLVDDFAYHEIVDERPDPTGALMGELVSTGLYNWAMPLIRYRTRDDVILNAAKSDCPCGRSGLPIIQSILGKQCDYLETPDGRLLGAVMSHSIDNGRGVVMSQCVQDALDHIYVNLVVDVSYNGESQAALERDLRKRLGDKMVIEFRLVPQLEKRPGGKTPFILSKIGHTFA
jgi:phenylacetate-CoA ligase